MMYLAELFCKIDDFCKEFEVIWNKQLIECGEKKRNRKRQLSMSEIMTIVVLFHQVGFRNFKNFYTQYVCVYLKNDFPDLVGYGRFVTLMLSVLMPLCAYLQTHKGKNTGISYIDSTSFNM